MEIKLTVGKTIVLLILMFIFFILFANWCAEEFDVKAAVVPTEFSGSSNAEITQNRFFDEADLRVLSAAMQLENGSGSNLCLLYTGSVILNRRTKGWADTLEGVIFQGYHDDSCYQQYATHTVKNLYTVEVSPRVKCLAVQLLMYGPIDSEVIYQSQNRHNGKNAFSIDGEWFAY